MGREQLKPNTILRGPIFPEPVQVIVALPLGEAVKVVARGLRTGQVHEPVLSADQLARIEASPEKEPLDGDPLKFRLGVEAMRLGLAYEHDPYFSLSIAQVDPRPHQLEAIYDCFIKQSRIRFLLTDDPGAGKTIMAGLLIQGPAMPTDLEPPLLRGKLGKILMRLRIRKEWKGSEARLGRGRDALLIIS